MKLSTKAALYSALIFPGAGFFLLKKHWFGTVFLIPASATIIYIIHYSMGVASAIAERIVAGQIALNVPAISAEITAALSGEGAYLFVLAKIGFIFIWLLSIALCFWMGKLAEKSLTDTQPADHQ